jgi:hypothetical protein
MALWDRFKSFINRGIEESPAFEPQTPEAPILPDEPLGGGFSLEPIGDSGGNPFYYGSSSYDAYESNHLIVIIDDYGVYHGELTFKEWWENSLLTSEEFHLKFGEDFYNVELIYLLEEEMDIDWDWSVWKEKYASVFA